MDLNDNDNATAPVTVLDDNPAGTPDAGANQPGPDLNDQGQTAGDQKGKTGQAKPPADNGQGKAPEPDILEFFDPKNVPEELSAAYKNMQAAFTSKTQAIAKDRHKIEQYDAFIANPAEQITEYVEKQGYQLVPKEQQAAHQQSQEQNGEFNPQSWGEVVDYMEEKLMTKFQSNLKPMIDTVQGMSQKNIEQQLNEIDPNWKLYENEMQTELQAHPTLAKDVNKLYRLSVPDNVLSQKAVQSALKKMENKVRGAAVHGPSTTKTMQPETKISSFGDAVNAAKAKLSL